jgi:hypothetical protein
LDVWDGFERGRLPDLGSVFALSALVAVNRFGFGVYGGGVDRFYDDPWIFTSPRAVMAIDFDCPASERNARLIAFKLAEYQGGWSLLDTGGSYHLVSHHLTRPEHIPVHYGNMLSLFADFTDEGSRKFFGRVGRWMTQAWNDWRVLRWLEDEILTNVRHWDQPGDDRPYTAPDSRWMAHALGELRRFLEEREKGFGFLRVGPKEVGGPIPTLKAEKTGGEVVIYTKNKADGVE